MKETDERLKERVSERERERFINESEPIKNRGEREREQWTARELKKTFFIFHFRGWGQQQKREKSFLLPRISLPRTNNNVIDFSTPYLRTKKKKRKSLFRFITPEKLSRLCPQVMTFQHTFIISFLGPSSD